MAVTKLNKKDDKNKDTKLNDEHKIAILNSLYFLDEIVVGIVFNRVTQEEKKISPEEYSKILVSSNTVSGINEQNQEEIVKMIEARAAEVRKGIKDFNFNYKLSLKNKDNKDVIGVFEVKKAISFVDDDKVVISYDLSDTNNNEIYKIIFDEVRNEYKKLETFDLDKLSIYMQKGILEMYNRVAMSNPNNIN